MSTTVTACPAPTTDDDLAVLAAEINVAHAQYVRASRRMVMCAHHAGALLLEVKAKLGHGQLGPWLKVHFDGSQRTANRYMRLARAYPDSTRLANLSLTGALEAMESTSRAERTPPEATAEHDPEPSTQAKPKGYVTVDGVKFPPGGITEPRDITEYETKNLKTVARSLIRRATPDEAAALYTLFTKYANMSLRAALDSEAAPRTGDAS